MKFIVKRFDGINGITVGIGVMFPFFDWSIGLANVRIKFDEGGWSRVKGDTCLAIKIQICAGGR